ncbi:MAG: ribosome maturation factor RimP [Firmicutes bacterium]|nr:ribosome maturation factor RimP [Bacillota bacterium]
MSKRVVQVTEELVRPIVEQLGLELVEVEFVREGGRWFLRVFIDKPGGVTLTDCQNVSERLGPLLDVKDPIPHPYHLEVSSPGLERPLKKPADYVRYQGHKVQVRTYAPVEGRRRFVGRLQKAGPEEITVEVDGVEFTIPLAQIAAARLAVEL